MIPWFYLVMLAAQFGLWALLQASPALRFSTHPADAVISRILVAMVLVGIVLSALKPELQAGHISWFG